MPGTIKLSKSMTVHDFDNGYWYVDELKQFAKDLGIPAAAKLRKDELEESIKYFLETGGVKNFAKRADKSDHLKDTEKGLALALQVVNYTSNKETKNFIVDQALRLEPGLKEKPGVRYRLNRWREAQLSDGKTISYGDLVRKYIELNKTEGKFARIPHGRYINFIADYLSHESNPTRKDAIAAWNQLKELDIPKDYESWKKHQKRIN